MLKKISFESEEDLPHYIIWQALIWIRFTLISPFLFLITIMLLHTLGFRSWELFFDKCILILLDADKNNFDALPLDKSKYQYIMGIDVGYEDADAIIDYLNFAKKYVTECEEKYGVEAGLEKWKSYVDLKRKTSARSLEYW